MKKTFTYCLISLLLFSCQKTETFEDKIEKLEERNKNIDDTITDVEDRIYLIERKLDSYFIISKDFKEELPNLENEASFYKDKISKIKNDIESIKESGYTLVESKIKEKENKLKEIEAKLREIELNILENEYISSEKDDDPIFSWSTVWSVALENKIDSIRYSITKNNISRCIHRRYLSDSYDYDFKFNEVQGCFVQKNEYVYIHPNIGSADVGLSGSYSYPGMGMSQDSIDMIIREIKNQYTVNNSYLGNPFKIEIIKHTKDSLIIKDETIFRELNIEIVRLSWMKNYMGSLP